MLAIIKDLARGKMFGHPVHAMLVHFPSALFPMTLVFQAIAFFKHDPTFAAAGFYTLIAGLAGGTAALVFGSIDYFRIDTKSRAWLKASVHAVCNLTWLTLFAVELGIILKHPAQAGQVSTAELVITAICVVGIMVSNFFGGELVFHYGIGVFGDRDRPQG